MTKGQWQCSSAGKVTVGLMSWVVARLYGISIIQAELSLISTLLTLLYIVCHRLGLRLFITSGQSNLAKGRIAAAHGRYFLYFIMGRRFPLKVAPYHEETWTDIQHMVSWANPSPQPKRYLDRFSRFCGAHDRKKQTDRLCYIGNNRPNLRT